VLKRDRSVDGQFFYSVRTTGVYCRPSCASRPARPENVEFHASAADAERAGYRPCKRCRPNEPSLLESHAELIAAACRTIESAELEPSLAELAQHAGLSRYHFLRVFKTITGVTPKQYAAAHRARRVRETLKTSTSVTDAIYDAGYNSNSRFYENANGMLGMSPKAFREGGRDTEIQYAISRCSLGSILVAHSQRGVCAIFFGDDAEQLVRDLKAQFPRAIVAPSSPEFARTVSEVVQFVEQPAVPLNVPLDIRGTAFQQRVWRALQEIPAGTTTSYAELARKIGQPRAVRAVANACANNSLAVAIPCHRVIGSNGKLTGYRWGVERTRSLLAREREDI
jgi:AraC family transcriptional regulator of adaptative response/methylated-DNA-[protein]-cysteine methyltransferase